MLSIVGINIATVVPETMSAACQAEPEPGHDVRTGVVSYLVVCMERGDLFSNIAGCVSESCKCVYGM